MTTILSVDMPLDNVVRLTFSEALKNEPTTFEPSHYSFKPRMAKAAQVFAESVAFPNSGDTTVVDVTLRQFPTKGGLYWAQVVGIRTDLGVEISPAIVFPFAAVSGLSARTQGLFRSLFNWANLKSTSVWASVLAGIGEADHDLAGTDPTTEGIAAARMGFLLRLAATDDLDILGQNYGVARPPGMDDDTYRGGIKALAFQPKLVLALLEELLTLLLGDKATIGWAVYEIRPHVITVDLGNYAVTRDATTEHFLCANSASTYDDVPQGFLSDSDLTDNPLPMVLGTPLSQYPFFSLFLDLYRAAGVTIEFKKPEE